MKIKFVLIFLIIIFVSGCGCSKKIKCPKDYTLEANLCVKTITRKALIDYYCDKGELQGIRCVWETKTTKPEIIDECPKDYYVFGNECRKGVVDTEKCAVNETYKDAICYPNVPVEKNYKCNIGSYLKETECYVEEFSVASTKYVCNSDEELKGDNCLKKETVNPK